MKTIKSKRIFYKPIVKTIEGSESLNILKAIIDYTRSKDKQGEV